jgi:hypothetical protein
MPPIYLRSLSESDGMQLSFGLAGFLTSIISIIVAFATWQLQKRGTRPSGKQPEAVEAISDLIHCSGNGGWELTLRFGRR